MLEERRLKSVFVRDAAKLLTLDMKYASDWEKIQKLALLVGVGDQNRVSGLPDEQILKSNKFLQKFSNKTLREAVQENDVILMSIYNDIRNSTLKLIKSMKWVMKSCPSVRYFIEN